MRRQTVAETAIQPYQASYSDIERMADAVVKSNLFNMKTKEQAITLMLIAQAEGMHPVQAALEFDIIQNRPARKSVALLARYQNAGGKVRWTEMTDTAVTGVFIHPASPEPVSIRWTIDDAKRAGLTSKDNWRSYPRAMLRARVISEGVRASYPGAGAVGIYTVEEVQDMPPAQPAPVLRIATPAQTSAAPTIDVEATPAPDGRAADPDADLILAIGEADKDTLKTIADEIRAGGKPASKAVRDAWLARSKAINGGVK